MEIGKLLWHEADPATDVRRSVPCSVAEKQGVTAPRLAQAQGRVDERRLPSAVAAKQARDGSRPGDKSNVFQNRSLAPVANGHLAEGYRFAHLLSSVCVQARLIASAMSLRLS